METIRDLLKGKPSPRLLGFYVAALGFFGVFGYAKLLIEGVELPMIDILYYLGMSLLFVVAGIMLWINKKRGWWFGWFAMISASLSGFLTHGPNQMPGIEHPSLFYAFFMLVAGAFFFCMLAHRDVYRSCFESENLPHAAYGAMPAIFIIVGGVALMLTGSVGLVAGPMVIIFTLIMTHWLYGPLLALIRGEKEWHVI